MTTKSPQFGIIGTIMESSLVQFMTVLAPAQQTHTVEIRLDPLRPKFHLFIPILQSCLTEVFIHKPIILTLRAKNQGGSEEISVEDQFLFWETLPENIRHFVAHPNSKVFVDWGLDLVMYAQAHGKEIFPWTKVGASLHDFSETPSDLEDRLLMLQETPAQAFLKLVTTVTDKDDDIPRLQNLFLGRTDQRPLIAFGMGILGQETRTKCMGWGSAGTYGYFQGHSKAAPGQLSVGELFGNPDVQAAIQGRN